MKLFNHDLHISVIADIKDIFKYNPDWQKLAYVNNILEISVCALLKAYTLIITNL